MSMNSESLKDTTYTALQHQGQYLTNAIIKVVIKARNMSVIWLQSV